METTKLQLTGMVRVAKSADLAYDDLAAALLISATQAVRERGVFHLALSGGKTPEPFFVRLVVDPRYRAIPWAQTHIWIVDERRVPVEDPRNNFGMIRQLLTDHLPMRTRQLHPVPVLEINPGELYEREIRQVVAGQTTRSTTAGAAGGPALPRLDFVVLGMGPDGHTASLFPHSRALNVQDRLVVENDGPEVTPPPRVTMTYPLLNAARRLAVLSVGEAKHEMLARIDQVLRRSGPVPAEFPITGIAPFDGDFTWFLDRSAAGEP